MGRKLNEALNVAIGTAGGVLVGTVLSRWLDVVQRPGLYGLSGAPWWLGLIGPVIVEGAVLALLIAGKIALRRRRRRKEQEENDEES